jgi:hypothetical protein
VQLRATAAGVERKSTPLYSRARWDRSSCGDRGRKKTFEFVLPDEAALA